MKGRQGQSLKRYAIFLLKTWFWRNVWKNMVNSERILTALGLSGHCSAHYDQVFSICFFSKLCPFQNCNIYLPKNKSCPSPSKFGSVCTLSNMIIWDLEILHAIYGELAMAPSGITKRLLPPLLQFSHPECLGHGKEGKTNRDARKSRGGGARIYMYLFTSLPSFLFQTSLRRKRK